MNTIHSEGNMTSYYLDEPQRNRVDILIEAGDCVTQDTTGLDGGVHNYTEEGERVNYEDGRIEYCDTFLYRGGCHMCGGDVACNEDGDTCLKEKHPRPEPKLRWVSSQLGDILVNEIGEWV